MKTRVRFHLPDAMSLRDHLHLPIQITDDKLRPYRNGILSDVIDLDEGLYAASIRLPDGRSLAAVTEIAAGMKSADVFFKGAFEEVVSAGQLSAPAISSDTGEVMGDAPAPGSARFECKLHLLKGTEWSGWTAHVPQDWDDSVVSYTGDPGGAYLSLPVSGTGEGQMIRFDRPEQRSVTIALPVHPGGSCEVQLRRTSRDGIFPHIRLSDADADLLLQYVGAGLLSDAFAVAKSPRLVARELIDDSDDDPIGAALGFYALLRRGENVDPRWTQKLVTTAPWLPDALVIHAEFLARGDGTDEAVSYLLRLPQRDLPMFTSGLAYAMERLGRYQRYVAQGLKPPRPGLSELLDRLRFRSLCSDPTRPILTFQSETVLSQRQFDAMPGKHIVVDVAEVPSSRQRSQFLRREKSAEAASTLRYQPPEALMNVSPQAFIPIESSDATAALLRVAALEWQVNPGTPRLSDDPAASSGSFIGLPPQIALLDDGRLARLLAPLTFVQASGIQWKVPAGVTLDGASIPRFLWSLIGGPFEGRYRNASIVHDHYCVTRTRTWRETHRVFYDAMRSSGESPAKAKIMYYAVYRFGPRWEATVPGTASQDSPAPDGVAQATSFAADAEAIYVHDLDLPEIEALADARNQSLAQDAATFADGGTNALSRARLLVIPGGKGTVADVDAVAEQAALLPNYVLATFERERVRVVACRGSVTDFETSLRGDRPRGWPAGMTWDSVPGTYLHDKKRVVIATVDAGGMRAVPPRESGLHGSTNLTVHESLHGFDYCRNHISLRDTRFRTARQADCPRLGRYEQQADPGGSEETFAESGVRFILDPSMPADWPNLFAFWQSGPFEALPSDMPVFDATTDTDAPIGMAQVEADGTITLDLRAEGPGGAIGHAQLNIGPDHPAHADVMAHIRDHEGLSSDAVTAGQIPFKPMSGG